MINVADNGVTCDCGSTRTASADTSKGELVICATCASVYRIQMMLMPVPWSTVEHELGERSLDLAMFNWHRGGVPPALRRTLPELADRRGRFANVDRAGALAGFVVLLVLVAIVRAVFS